MNKADIENSLRKKFDDEYTIKMLTNYVLEFQECFSDIISTEEVVRRLMNNISGNIILMDELPNKNLDGQYSRDGYVKLKTSTTKDEEYCKYLLFHELTHAITSVRDENGNETMLRFSDMRTNMGRGFNEAITEYLSQIRNEKITGNKNLISGYRTIVEQARRLFKIIGKDKVLQSYFYSPEDFKDLIEKHNMNYEELEEAFQYFIGKDGELWNIGRERKLESNENYILYEYADKIFRNYSNAIGEVNTLEDFQRKYKIFQTCTEGSFDCILTMYASYYNHMGQDIDRLISNGVSFDKIRPILSKLGINLNNLSIMYNFSKSFGKDKNRAAISMYEWYSKNPQLYNQILAKNYGMVYDFFSETDLIPTDNELYNFLTYPMIGKLLKNHPEIDYDDVSFNEIEDEYLNMKAYIFKTSDGRNFCYLADGRPVYYEKNKENQDIFKFKINVDTTLSFEISENGNINFRFDSSPETDLRSIINRVSFKNFYKYSERENIKYCIEQGYDKNGEYARKLEEIDRRIASRRTKSIGES